MTTLFYSAFERTGTTPLRLHMCLRHNFTLRLSRVLNRFGLWSYSVVISKGSVGAGILPQNNSAPFSLGTLLAGK